MRPRVFPNLCRMLWSDLLWTGATLLVLGAEALASRSVAVAAEARIEREGWWRAGYSWRDGRLVPP